MPEAISPDRQAPTCLLIEIAGQPGAYVASLWLFLDLVSAPLHLDGAPRVPLDAERLLTLAGQPRAYGEELTRQLFADPAMRALWEKAQLRAAGQALHVRLSFKDDLAALHSLAWETLGGPPGGLGGEGGPLALQPESPLARIIAPDPLRSRGLVRASRPPQLSVLALVANPGDLARANLAPLAAREYVEPLRAICSGAQLELLGRDIGDGAGEASLERLHDKVAQQRPQILCLIAHGVVARDDEGDHYAICMEQRDGTLRRLPAAALAETIASLTHKPDLIVLALCDSGGRTHDEVAIATLGPLLARAGVSAVVGMQGRVQMRSMAVFLPALLAAVLEDGRVDRAVAVARARLKTALHDDPDPAVRDSDDWWKPVLLMRALDGRLWQDPDPAEARRHAEAEIRRKAAEDQLRRYLDATSDACNQLPLRIAELEHIELPISKVFVDLALAPRPGSSRRRPTEGVTARPRTALEAVAHYHCLVLTGLAGSGKSSVCLYLAYWLSQAHLLRRDAQAHRHAREQLGPCQHLSELVPLRVELPALETHLRQRRRRKPAETGADALWHYLRTLPAPLPATVELLRQRTEAGLTLLIFEGLDGVEWEPGKPPLVVGLLRDLMLRLADTARIIVTCRPGEEILSQLPQSDRWRIERLAELTEEAQQQLLSRWFAGWRERAERGQSAVGADHGDVVHPYYEEHRVRDRLREDLAAKESLRVFGRNPQSFTWMFLSYRLVSAVRSERVALLTILDRAIATLLDRALAPFATGSMGAKRASCWNERRSYREFLMLLAERLLWHGPASATAMSEADTTALAVAYLARVECDNAGAEADQLMRHLRKWQSPFIALRGDEGKRQHSYSFSVPPLQEYLAAEALMSERLALSDDQDAHQDVISRVLRRSAEPHWRESLLFVASRLVRDRRAREAVYLSGELLARASGDQELALLTLAANLLVEVERQRVESLGKRARRVWGAVAIRLGRAVTESGPAWRALSAVERLRVGRLLARLGDRREGVRALCPAWSAPLEAGAYAIEAGERRVALAPFRIAVLPVSVAQYRAFRDDPGAYQDPRWWMFGSDDIHELLDYSHQGGGTSLDTVDSNLPATSLSWYEATAYCRWLTARSHEQGWIEPDEEIRLPSEAEWMAAAFCHPRSGDWKGWSPAARPYLEQLTDAAVKHPFTAGLFPELASWCGALDMGGNIYELCASPARPLELEVKAQRPDSFNPGQLEIHPVHCGGRHRRLIDSPWQAHDSLRPQSTDHEVGFRVVRARGSAQ